MQYELTMEREERGERVEKNTGSFQGIDSLIIYTRVYNFYLLLKKKNCL